MEWTKDRKPLLSNSKNIENLYYRMAKRLTFQTNKRYNFVKLNTLHSICVGTCSHVNEKLKMTQKSIVHSQRGVIFDDNVIPHIIQNPNYNLNQEEAPLKINISRL